MGLRTFIENKVNTNHLGLDTNVVEEEILKLKSSGHPVQDEYELFYIYLLNMLGRIILNIDNGEVKRAEMLGWLKVKTKVINNQTTYYYLFETTDDYYNWLNMRHDIYDQIHDIKEIRILNFIEMSTFDFITDTINNCKYIFKHKRKKKIIQKTGMISSENGQKFSKIIAEYFNKNYTFKPIK